MTAATRIADATGGQHGIQLTPRQRDVRAAWGRGREFGAWEAKSEHSYRLPMGMAIGVAIGAVIQPIVFWLKGVGW